MTNGFNKDDIIINLTIEGSAYEEVEVKVTNPNKTIREQIDSIIRVFELPKMNRWGYQIPYLLGLILNDSEEPVYLSFEDEEGNAQSLLDYDIKSGDHLVLDVPPYLG